MQSKLLNEADGKRTFAVILQKGDEAMRRLQDFAERAPRRVANECE
jgi:predicted DNA-binding protein with PD1-like motif